VLAVPSLRTRCAVLPRRALQSVVSLSGLARQAMGCRHREQPKLSEEGIRPSFVIVETSSLTRSVILFSQHRPQSTSDKGVDRREREAVGLLEVGVPPQPGSVLRLPLMGRRPSSHFSSVGEPFGPCVAVRSPLSNSWGKGAFCRRQTELDSFSSTFAQSRTLDRSRRQEMAASVKPCRVPRADIRRLHRGGARRLLVPGAGALRDVPRPPACGPTVCARRPP
jgi:hypothetical protein